MAQYLHFRTLKFPLNKYIALPKSWLMLMMWAPIFLLWIVSWLSSKQSPMHLQLVCLLVWFGLDANHKVNIRLGPAGYQGFDPSPNGFLNVHWWVDISLLVNVLFNYLFSIRIKVASLKTLARDNNTWDKYQPARLGVNMCKLTSMAIWSNFQMGGQLDKVISKKQSAVLA